MSVHRPPLLRHRMELAALRGLTFAVRRIPYPVALALGWGLAQVFLPLFRHRTDEARRRIRAVFGPGVSDAWVRHVAHRSLRNIVFSIVDLLRAPIITRPWADRHVEGDAAIRAIKEACGEGGGILAMPHMGSWELSARVGILHGLRPFSIAAHQKNTLVSDYINGLRNESGMPILVRGAGTLREAIRSLRRGLVMAILPDLRKRTPGIAVPFLGAEANVADGMAALARAANVPIVPCYNVRKGWTRHLIVAEQAVRPDRRADKQADIERMTREVFNVLDAAIRAHPEQWFWHNRRWVLEPLSEEEQRTPDGVGDRDGDGNPE